MSSFTVCSATYLVTLFPATFGTIVGNEKLESPELVDKAIGISMIGIGCLASTYLFNFRQSIHNQFLRLERVVRAPLVNQYIGFFLSLYPALFGYILAQRKLESSELAEIALDSSIVGLGCLASAYLFKCRALTQPQLFQSERIIIDGLSITGKVAIITSSIVLFMTSFFSDKRTNSQKITITQDFIEKMRTSILRCPEANTKFGQLFTESKLDLWSSSKNICYGLINRCLISNKQRPAELFSTLVSFMIGQSDYDLAWDLWRKVQTISKDEYESGIAELQQKLIGNMFQLYVNCHQAWDVDSFSLPALNLTTSLSAFGWDGIYNAWEEKNVKG